MTPEQEAAWQVQNIIDQQARDRETKLALMDLRMARVTEDLIDTLVAKGVISETDLPSTAVELLASRKEIRAQQPAVLPDSTATTEASPTS